MEDEPILTSIFFRWVGLTTNKSMNVLGFITQTIHVWYMYLHLVDFYGKCIGKYTNPMDPMGHVSYHES